MQTPYSQIMDFCKNKNVSELQSKILLHKFYKDYYEVIENYKKKENKEPTKEILEGFESTLLSETTLQGNLKLSDGSVWHSSEKALNREVKKYEECIKQGIFLIRVKEKNGVLKEGSCNVLIRTDSNYNNETYKKLFSELNNYIDIPDDIDVVRDRIHILENYRTELKNKSVGTLYPHLVLEWDTEKNGLLTPFMFTPGSGEKVWWICNMNHRWQASIVSRTKGSKCPYCSGICVIRGKNDLATLRPDIAAEWNDEKNGELKPCNLKIKSNKKVWWKCKNGHEWQAIISNRTNKNQGCPFCKKDDSES